MPVWRSPLFAVLLEVEIPKLDEPIVIRDVHDDRELANSFRRDAHPPM